MTVIRPPAQRQIKVIDKDDEMIKRIEDSFNQDRFLQRDFRFNQSNRNSNSYDNQNETE